MPSPNDYYHLQLPSFYFFARIHSMALNLDAMGRPIGPLTKAYNWRDIIMTVSTQSGDFVITNGIAEFYPE